MQTLPQAESARLGELLQLESKSTRTDLGCIGTICLRADKWPDKNCEMPIAHWSSEWEAAHLERDGPIDSIGTMRRERDLIGLIECTGLSAHLCPPTSPETHSCRPCKAGELCARLA